MANLVLESLDIRPDVQKKAEISAFIKGSDITSRYRDLRCVTAVLQVTLRSPLNTCSLSLPRNLKLSELWELAFRLSKGLHAHFELQHCNARLAHSEDTMKLIINTDHPIFITPFDPVSSSGHISLHEDLCLVKVYDSSFERLVMSYWESKKTTHSLSSAVFRYYRAKFSIAPTSAVGKPVHFSNNLYCVGDGYFTSTTLDKPWEPLSNFFNHDNCIGSLSEEDCINPAEENPNSQKYRGPQHASFASGQSGPLVFKLALRRPKRSAMDRTRALTRLDVLKQMFDAFINGMLAYNLQTHIGLVTIGSKASVSQGITGAVENFRHKLSGMVASGDAALWDSESASIISLSAHICGLGNYA